MAERDPEPGDLLVASVLLADGVFNQTVVLVLDSDEDGALGRDPERDLPDPAGRGAAGLGDGGVPSRSCCSTAVRCRRTGRSAWPAWPRPGEEPPGWRPLFDGVGPAAPGHPDRDRRRGRTADLRIFAGYAGWAAGQLQAEIAEGMWHVVDADYADVFGAEPLDLWRRVLRRQRSPVALFSTWLEDPDLN